MKIKTNYHSHNTFCDGKSTMEEMVLAAIDKQFTHFGISSHAPMPQNPYFALKNEEFSAYNQEFLRLKDQYKNKIRLYLGLEMDFVSGFVESIKTKAQNEYKLDYFIGSVHQVANPEFEIKSINDIYNTWFIDGSKQETYDEGLKMIFDGDIRKAVECFYTSQMEMIKQNRPDVLGHADKIVMHNQNRHFTEQETWYKDLVVALWDTVIQYNTIVEVNTRGIYRKRHNDFYPSSYWVKYLVQKNVPLIISTDCHKKEEVDLCYKDALDFLKIAGCKQLFYFENEWKQEKIENFE